MYLVMCPYCLRPQEQAEGEDVTHCYGCGSDLTYPEGEPPATVVAVRESWEEVATVEVRR